MLRDSAQLRGANAKIANTPAKAGKKTRPNVRMETPKVRNPPCHPRRGTVNPHKY